jgi:hypothetical protein
MSKEKRFGALPLVNVNNVNRAVITVGLICEESGFKSGSEENRKRRDLNDSADRDI